MDVRLYGQSHTRRFLRYFRQFFVHLFPASQWSCRTQRTQGSCSNAKWAWMTESNWLCSTIEYQLYPIWAMYVDHSSLSGFQLFHGARLLSEKLSTAASRHVSPTITTDCWLSQVRGVALQEFGCQTKRPDSHNNDMTQCADGCRDRRRRGAEGM